MSMIITRLSDQKQYSEESLAELLLDEYDIDSSGAFEPALVYSGHLWSIGYYKPGKSVHSKVTIDPSRFIITPSGYVEISKVREMVEEIKAIIRPDEFKDAHVATVELNGLTPAIDRIASQFFKDLVCG